MIIASTLENLKLEKRIAITPEMAKKYISSGFEINITKIMESILGLTIVILKL